MLKHCIIIISIITTNICVAYESPPQITEASCPAANRSNVPYTPFEQLPAADIAKFLGWIRDPKSCTLCGGRYVDPTNITNTPNPRGMKETPMNITSTEHALLVQSGISVVKGNVTLIQPGREISADCATFFRDNKTGKINDSVLIGHVNFHEPGKLLVAEQANLNFVSEAHTLDNGFYRMLSSTPSGITNIWGRAKHTLRDAMGVLKMRRATYSSCPPDAASWHIWSNKLILDRNTGRGEAFNALFFFQKVPVFYTPYFNFPIDKRRKSGFLFPSMSTSKDSGLGLTLPYYFNLAPNYDATLTPTLFTKRGIFLDGLFRYLTPANNGTLGVNFIPHDRIFAKFRDGFSSYEDTHARSALQNSSANRGLLRLQNNASFNDHWKGSLTGNYVTDDYFLQDFGSTTTTINDDQLFNQAEINYNNYNNYNNHQWRFASRVQGFQTLHRMNQNGGKSLAQDQYKKLPQLDLAGDFPDSFGGLNYQFDSGAVNFVHRDNFDDFKPKVAGGRFNLGAGASLPLNWLGAYITPKIQLQATGYTLHDQKKTTDPNNIARVLPIVSVDSGMIFSRDINFFQHAYIQTLEPRLFYLFVPTKNQDNIPIFDTVFPALDFSQLFRTNRFGGFDRIGDANQITAAITTRFLDDSGQEKLNAGLGQIISIHKHQVFIPEDISTTPDPLAHETLSPLVGQLEYFITPKVNAKAGTAWDPSNQRFKTSSINLQYNDNAEKVINFGYTYGLRGDPSTLKPTADLSRISCSVGWRLWQHWNILGGLDYNTSYNRAQTGIYGLEYDSCCWALRLVQSKTFVGTNIKYETKTFLQLFLKGLGEPTGFNFIGTGSTLPASIGGYNDKRFIGL